MFSLRHLRCKSTSSWRHSHGDSSKWFGVWHGGKLSSEEPPLSSYGEKHECHLQINNLSCFHRVNISSCTWSRFGRCSPKWTMVGNSQQKWRKWETPQNHSKSASCGLVNYCNSPRFNVMISFLEAQRTFVGKPYVSNHLYISYCWWVVSMPYYILDRSVWTWANMGTPPVYRCNGVSNFQRPPLLYYRYIVQYPILLYTMVHCHHDILLANYCHPVLLVCYHHPIILSCCSFVSYLYTMLELC